MPAVPRSVRFRFRCCASLNLGVYLGVVAVLLLLILRGTHLHFSYVLDDPYIHLALAERLRHGLYGINAGEAASPSSSIVWPLLLVPFAGMRWMAWVPLGWNVLFGGATAWLLGDLVDRRFQSTGATAWRARCLGVLLVVGTNLIGLTFTGLEHSLEVLLCMMAAGAVLAVVDGERVPRTALLAAVILPSVRYEGLLIACAVGVALWSVRARRTAVLVVAGSLVVPVCFSAYLHHLRLPLFPMSVLVKATTEVGVQHVTASLVYHRTLDLFRNTLLEPERAQQLVLVIALAYFAWRNRRNRSVRLALLGAGGAGVVQLLIGPVGWFFRYEIYCLMFTLVIAVAMEARRSVAGWNESGAGTWRSAEPHLTAEPVGAEMLAPKPPVAGMLLMLAGTLALVYCRPLLLVPRTAIGIYEQQEQMGRFASEYFKAPVALNDLGWVSFERRPEEYVLDLAGLGSYEAFKTKKAAKTPQWLDSVTRKHGVQLVMIYPSWFGEVPTDWTAVALLCGSDIDAGVGAGGTCVEFFATPLTDRAKLFAALRAFKGTLPKGSRLLTATTEVRTTTVWE